MTRALEDCVPSTRNANVNGLAQCREPLRVWDRCPQRSFILEMRGGDVKMSTQAHVVPNE